MSLSPIVSGFEALRSNPLRTFLSTLGVIIGVASLVAVLSIGDSLEEFSRRQIEETSDLQSISVSPVTTDRVDGVSIRRDDSPALGLDHIDSLKEVAGPKSVVSLSVVGAGRISVPGDTTVRGALVIATLPEAQTMLPNHLESGRFVDGADMRDSTMVAVVTADLGDHMPAAVGEHVDVDGRRLRIVGVLARPSVSMATRVFVPFSIAHTLPGLTGKSPVATIRVADIQDVERAGDQVRSWIDREFGTDQPYFTVVNNRARARQAAQAMMVFKLAMGAITGIALLVGGIGIMNILLASVVERTREIGVRRSTGARRRDIVLQFLAESVAIASVGALAGLLLGIVMSFLAMGVIRSITEAPIRPAFTLWTMIVAAAAAVLVGLVFGTYPARRAARLEPADAVRHE